VKKKILLVFVGLFGLLYIGLVIWQTNITQQKETVRQVKEYLVIKKGYKNEDILKIEGAKEEHVPAYQVVVIFRDEPDWRYYYRINPGGSVYQSSFAPPDGKLPSDSKHKDINK
jgi:hypothetical protein